MAAPVVTQEMIDTYQRDGVVLIKGLWTDWVEVIRKGIERNMAEPGPYAAENLKPGEGGRFFDDYCNWTRIPEFAEVIKNSAVADVAARLMQSDTVQVFHDHVLVKEPGTSKPTPWHQDGPYYFVEGSQTVSFWSPVDPVKEASLRCVAGSHLWEKEVMPMRWLAETSFYPNPEKYMAVPDPDAEGMRVLEWAMEPGDAVAFTKLAVILGADLARGVFLDVAAGELPLAADHREAGGDFDRRFGIGVGPAGVIDVERGLAARRLEVDRPHRHFQGSDVDFSRTADRAGGHADFELAVDVGQGRAPVRKRWIRNA